MPSPVGCGWKLNFNFISENDWVDGGQIPQLFDVLEKQSNERDSYDAEEMIQEEVDDDDVFENIVDVSLII
jgi:hypothetical protein